MSTRNRLVKRRHHHTGGRLRRLSGEIAIVRYPHANPRDEQLREGR